MAGIAVLSKPMASAAAITRRINTFAASRNNVAIYHTNDLRGELGPTVDNWGGLDQIKTILEREETGDLILDAGDFLNASHSMQQQKAVIHTMNSIGYHAATIGDQELLNGQNHLAALVPLMQFSLVNCNYEFNSRISKLIKPYVIIYSGKYKIGITGVGRQVDGIVYKDALLHANQMASILKTKECCDLVICLSHLGYAQNTDKPDNIKLARQSEYIDMIVSGHGHKLLSGPAVVLNKRKEQVIISQTAWDGLMVGKTIFNFENGGQQFNFRGKYFIAGQTYGQTFHESFAALRSIEKRPA